MIPTTQLTFSNTQLLQLATEELETFIVGALMRVHEEYLVVTDSVALVVGQDHYRIPSRAIGRVLRDVIYVENGGNQTRLPRILREELAEYDNIASQRPMGFYMEGDYIVLITAPSAAINGASLNVSYFQRPGQLVDAGFYLNSSGVSGSTISFMGTAPTTFVTGASIDIISATSGNVTLYRNLTILSVVGTVITFTSDVSLSAVGDYICLANQSGVPQCPEEMHPLLAQRVAVRVLAALNDQNGLAQANIELAKMEKNIIGMVDNRVDGKPHKIINRTGLLISSRS